MSAKNILFSTNHQKIISLLAENSDKSFTEKEIVKDTGVSKTGVNAVLKELEGSGLVLREKRGRMSFWSVDDSIPLIQELKKTQNLSTLFPLVQKLKPVAKRIILYGSTATGTDTSESDIDLFVLTENKNEVFKEIRAFKTHREIKPVVQTTLEYATSRKKDKVFYEQVAKGIILFEKEADEQRL